MLHPVRFAFCFVLAANARKEKLHMPLILPCRTGVTRATSATSVASVTSATSATSAISATSASVNSACCQFYSCAKRLVFPTVVLPYPIQHLYIFPLVLTCMKSMACTGQGGVRGGEDREGPALPRRPHRYTCCFSQPPLPLQNLDLLVEVPACHSTPTLVALVAATLLL